MHAKTEYSLILVHYNSKTGLTERAIQVLDKELTTAIYKITELLEEVDCNNTDAMFDCLAEIDLIACDTIANYSVTKLSHAGIENLKIAEGIIIAA